MGIMDRYLLRQFARTFLICFLSLTGLYIVFDAFANLEEFMRYDQQTGGVWRLLASFYGYQSIVFFDKTAGLITLVAATFTVSWFQRHNEMTALQAAGISRVRIVTPVIVVAVLISILAAANRELVIPRFRDELSRRPQDIVGDKAQPLEPRYDNRTDVLMRGRNTYANEMRIQNPDFLLPRGLRRYGKQLVAANAFYRPPRDGRPEGYLLQGVVEPKGLAGLPSLSLGDEPILITPRDAPWLKADECFLKSEVTFDLLTGGRAFKEFSSTAQLISGLHKEVNDFGADLRTKIHTRLVNPFLDLTLLFLGLPLVVSRESRNVFVAVGMCFGVTVVFLLVVIGCGQMGANSMVDPALAAWLPLIIFVPVAVGVTESMWR
jgi:lipopolysaccharide export system permease protein